MTIEPRSTAPRQGLVPTWTIGDRLRKARELTGLSQTQFATEIDISKGTMVNYETEKVKPRRIVLKQWALRSGVSLAWLEFGVGQKDTPADNVDGGDLGCTPRDLNPEPID